MDLMDFLLVPYNGQLVPASSLSDKCDTSAKRGIDEEGEVSKSEVAAGPISASDSPRLSNLARLDQRRGRRPAHNVTSVYHHAPGDSNPPPSAQATMQSSRKTRERHQSPTEDGRVQPHSNVPRYTNAREQRVVERLDFFSSQLLPSSQRSNATSTPRSSQRDHRKDTSKMDTEPLVQDRVLSSTPNGLPQAHGLPRAHGLPHTHGLPRVHEPNTIPFEDYVQNYVPPQQQVQQPRWSPSLVAPNLKSIPSTGEHTGIFYQSCSLRKVTPEFEFQETCPGFSVKVLIGGQVLDEAGNYVSKNQAKEQVCKSALSKLERFEVPQSKKRKSTDLTDVSPVPADLGDEGWVGVLHEYLQGRHLGNPDFDIRGEHFTLGPFTCKLTFSTGATPFTSGPFTSKDKAKKVAAREAVLWLRAQGLLPQPTAKRRKFIPDDVQLAPHQTGLTQAVQGVDIDASPAPEDATFVQKVQHLALQLRASPYRYDLQPIESFPGFWNVCVYFEDEVVRYNPRLAGAIGTVERVYGQKKAKEDCCREVLRVLEGVKEERMRDAQFVGGL